MKKNIILVCLCLCSSWAWAEQISVKNAQILNGSALASDQMGNHHLPVGAEQWQLTFDVIASKVKRLMEENNLLVTQYQTRLAQQQKLHLAINDQTLKNEAIKKFLKERNGKTDQQIRLEELNAQMKLKKPAATLKEREANVLKSQVLDWQHKIELKKLKIAEWELHQNMPAPVAEVKPAEEDSSVDQELNSLRKELETQKAQEVGLEQKLEVLRNHSKVTDGQGKADAAALGQEMKSLQQRLDFLRKQKFSLLARVPAASQNSVADRNRYQQMMNRKADLESKIRNFEIRINLLRDPSTFGLSWVSQKKELIRDIVAADAANGQMRAKINNLREDIALLEEQIAKMDKKTPVNAEDKKK